jgi:hypothetical protein
MLKLMSKMITRIPRSATTKKISAMFSSSFSLTRFVVLMEIKEMIQEKVSITATIEVNSSMR